MKEKIIIDTDIGVDDALAVAYGALRCDLLALTTVFGNTTLDQVVKNAKFFLKRIGRPDIPVYRGASRALALAPTEPFAAIHGGDGLGGVFDNKEDASAPDAICYLIKTIMDNPGQINVLPVGPLTNIAMALNLEPKIAQNIKSLIIMGGAFGHKGYSGNVTPMAEFNIWKDPDAADQVLSSAMPISLVPLDLTQQVLLNAPDLQRTKPYIVDMTRSYLDFYLTTTGLAGMAMHDAMAVAYLLYPEKFEVKKSPLRVITEGIALGQTQMKLIDRETKDCPFEHCRVQDICLNTDVEFIKNDILESLAKLPD